MIVLPPTSITAAPAGACSEPVRPIAAIRSPVTTISARSSTSSPFMVTARAFFRTIDPFGRGFAATRVIGIASGFGNSVPVSFAVSAFLDSSAFSLAFSSWAFFRIASRTRPSRWR